MKYFLILVTSFSAVLFSWAVLWYGSLGGYQKAEHWLRDVYRIKSFSANEIKDPKIIIASGSNGLFGISSDVISKETGYPVINMAGHAGLPFSFIADKVQRVASSGDIVIMPLEYGFYSRDEGLTDWQLSNMQSWGAEYLTSSSLRQLFRYFKRTDFSSFVERSFGVQDAEYLSSEEVATYCAESKYLDRRWRGYNYKSMNCSGDILVDREAVQKISNLQDEGTREYITTSDVSDNFSSGAIRFSKNLGRSGVSVYFTWPSTIKNKNFDLHETGSPRRTIDSLEKNLSKLGLSPICDPEDFNINVEHFFNTDYHLNKRGAILRSVRLSDCINQEVLGVAKEYSSEHSRVNKYYSGKYEMSIIRVSHLRALKNALEQFESVNGNYPESHSWDGLHTKWGESKEDWIDGLVPDYIDSLPRDPRNNDDGSQQYIYRSNGRSFKLIAHGVRGDCSFIKSEHPEMIDPVRNCNAYGFWSDGAKDW